MTASRRTAQSIVERVEASAKTAAEQIAAAKASGKPDEWIPEWFKFRHQFGATRAAADLVASYDRQRAEERDESLTLFRAARGHFREKARDEAERQLDGLATTAWSSVSCVTSPPRSR